jgi:PGF-pre-PGF domain-containing protein
VGSPAPIERILARYARAFPAAKVVVADVLELPAGVPPLPAGRKLNSLLTLSPQGFTDDDIITAHATLFVEKSWLEANQVHEWSIQFSRFDEEQSAWRPATAKRVREDEERVFFSVVIPGFSLWAISGSEEVPEVEFRVDDLTITPASAPVGESITVQVQVTNLTSEPAEFNIALWLNSLVDTTKAVPVAPNKTVPVTFTVEPNEGSYEVRIDRLLGNFVVGPAIPVAVPVVAVEVPATPVAMPAIAAVAAEPLPVAAPPPDAPAVTPVVIPPPERGVGVIVGIIVGVLVAVGVVGTVVAIYLGAREPLPPPPPAGPPEEGEPPETPEEPSASAEEAPAENSEEEGQGESTANEGRPSRS